MLAASFILSTSMALDFDTLDELRAHHPAWRLLRSDHAPLIASFLYRVFIEPNVRVMSAADLTESLEDTLYALRQQRNEGAFPRSAQDYLNDWSGSDKGWLRKFYRPGSDEPQFDLTPAVEKAVGWLGQLSERSFVGTESRLLTLFELLRQMSEGSETDPERRIAELRSRRDAIDAQIAQVVAGNLPMLDDTAIKDRFQQFTQLARELLTDFREVEDNFRRLDRRVRERIALWEGRKGELLDEIMGEHDAIGDSDQGKSFKAFWSFLMSSRRQEELTELLERVLALPPVNELRPDARTRRVHYDWLEAGEHTQRTVAQLSQQLRRFLDDQTWLENRRIMDLLHGIETKALKLRGAPPTGEVVSIAEAAAGIELPFERPLHTPKVKPLIADVMLLAGEENLDPSALFAQSMVDRQRLAHHIRAALQLRSQVTLRELIEQQPLRHGLAELLAYLQLGSESFRVEVDEDRTDQIQWDALSQAGELIQRQARLQRIIFVRAA